MENDRIPLGASRAAVLAEALDVSVLELLPEAPPDERGVTLLDRLGLLAVEVGRLEDSHVQLHEKLDELLAAVRDGFRQREAPTTQTGSQQ